jgi:hypothetical protein
MSLISVVQLAKAVAYNHMHGRVEPVDEELFALLVASYQSSIGVVVDGALGPRTMAELTDLRDAITPVPSSPITQLAVPPPPQSVFGLAALRIAEREIDHGEQGRNNYGPDLERYRRGTTGAGDAWCAAFISYCLEEGALQLHKPCPIVRSHSAKTLFARCLAVGYAVEEPKPGDLACYHRGAANAITGHINIVKRGLIDGEWISIDGNRGGFPSKVRTYPHELDEPLFLGFARLS